MYPCKVHRKVDKRYQRHLFLYKKVILKILVIEFNQSMSKSRRDYIIQKERKKNLSLLVNCKMENHKEVEK